MGAVYLPVPAAIAPDTVIGVMAAAPADPAVEAVRLIPTDGAEEDEGALKALIESLQQRDIACLVTDDIEAARRLGADGIHLSAPTLSSLRVARQSYPGGTVGASVPLTRHDAMSLAEAGLDYVGFSTLPAPGPPAPGAEPSSQGASPVDATALIAWWSEVMVLPCVAEDVRDPEMGRHLLSYGADFVAPDIGLWDEGEEGVSAFLSRLAAVAGR